MCNTMWGEAFNVSNAEGFDEHAYTMWFYQLANPNFDTASYWNKSLGTNSAGQYECLLEYYPENHLDYSVTQTTGDWGECQAYSQHSCCKNTTVASFETVNQAYGPEYHIDRCGPLSQACENYFMNENCLYECDPTAGLYRRYSQAMVAADVAANGSMTWTNEWELYKMPIRASFCNAWYSACYDDLFCSVGGGDFFSCAMVYDDHSEDESDKYREWKQEYTTITVVVGIFGLLMLGVVGYLIHRERRGDALFRPLAAEEEKMVFPSDVVGQEDHL
mmetsp:Transcript_24952/g.55363  ORF Transcript_24952/g.55363 Transcript_24952/m.55363 type:complete len:276 (+) Transcript_24952:560-1387(+)